MRDEIQVLDFWPTCISRACINQEKAPFLIYIYTEETDKCFFKNPTQAFIGGAALHTESRQCKNSVYIISIHTMDCLIWTQTPLPSLISLSSLQSLTFPMDPWLRLWIFPGKAVYHQSPQNVVKILQIFQSDYI